ncbi:MAG: bifunctional precorrin-2 dehydrogenase/sirohydrochlorin ferrochelatase [Nitrososphaerota archaeon]|nr:bifunctional precorrin-2 dehydrogenase/sirohydrochlorin ferrochelatase [Nitrososphaerota archaeon]MDG6966572.1 bifunctional precorrin-2 dehydrogenase/sirohydrochlorin ferrochelatase [Nitrososphaerota archaeon]MDG6978569.1 bifunctional precorrin-2 dehydrogenase/sirohydrochlorin ferrochelatase [Nitrososphaerota archaeon]
MLVDLVLARRECVVVGGGKEPELKALKLIDARARVTVVAERFTRGLRELASRSHGAVTLAREEVSADALRRVMREKEPFVVFISTGDRDLDEELAEAARRTSGPTPIVCVVDDPRLNDFNMPAIAEVGEIRVGVSTGGLSPAMAGVLRRRIEKLIAPEDVLQVRLQGHVRGLAKEVLAGPAERKEFAYKVIGDRRISALLKQGSYAKARRRAEALLRSAGKADEG